MEILKTDPLDSGLEKSEKQDGETGRCNQRHDCGTQGTQYGLNAFKTAVFIVKDGMIQPRVQRITPKGPESLMPTKVEELMEIGPGVISAIVIKSVNSSRVINP